MRTFKREGKNSSSAPNDTSPASSSKAPVLVAFSRAKTPNPLSRGDDPITRNQGYKRTVQQSIFVEPRLPRNQQNPPHSQGTKKQQRTRNEQLSLLSPVRGREQVRSFRRKQGQLEKKIRAVVLEDPDPSACVKLLYTVAVQHEYELTRNKK